MNLEPAMFPNASFIKISLGIIHHFNKSSKTPYGEDIWKAILSACARYANRSRQWHFKQQQVPATQWAYGWATAADFMIHVSNRANAKDPFYGLYRSLNSLERGILNSRKPVAVSFYFRSFIGFLLKHSILSSCLQQQIVYQNNN